MKFTASKVIRALRGPGGNANQDTLDSRLRPWPYPVVDLFFWRPSDGRINFGDSLSKVIVNLVLARHGLTLDDEVSEARQLLAIGSILHFANDDAVVWGSGINMKIDPSSHRFQSLDVRAVRGPLTREFLSKRGITVPEVYGDPALLLPMLAPGRFTVSRDRGPVFVPNLNDFREITRNTPSKVPLLSPMQSWNRCIEEILKHDFVLASSLHGLIVAEAYGIPARYVRVTETENLFKYQDYYAGTGRTKFSFARSVEEGLEMGGEVGPKFNGDALLGAFPVDLWSAALR